MQLIYFLLIFSMLSGFTCKKQKKNNFQEDGGSSNSVRVKYFWYTRSNRGGVRIANDKLPSDFDRGLPTYLFVHGLASHHNTPCQKAMRNAVLDRERANVIVPNYTNSSTMYTLVYQEVARRVGSFLQKEGINGSNTRVVGASLGAHVAGLLRRRSGFRPREIYGLDPAGPIFDRMSENQRLSPESADYVQAIHTNTGAFGILAPVANDDVYVNGGNDYPCCTSNTCRHSGACDIFVRSIRNGPLQARTCDSLTEARSSSCRGPSRDVGFGAQPTSRRIISHLSVERCFGLAGS